MKWYVGFLPSPNRGIFRLFAGYGQKTSHCFVFRPLESGGWLLVERSSLCLHVHVFDDDRGLTLIDVCRRKGRLLLAEQEKGRPSLWPNPWATCTESVMSVLQIKTWRIIITPKQLLCELLRRGAQSL